MSMPDSYEYAESVKTMDSDLESDLEEELEFDNWDDWSGCPQYDQDEEKEEGEL